MSFQFLNQYYQELGRPKSKIPEMQFYVLEILHQLQKMPHYETLLDYFAQKGLELFSLGFQI